MNKKITTLIGATLAVCAYSSNAASVVGTPFSFAIDAAQDPTYSSNPGNDVSLGDSFTADSPFTVNTTFDVNSGEKLIGVLHYHNSAASIGTLTGVSFGGQALDFATGATGGFGASVAITYWDATSNISDGAFSVSFTGNIDEFSFTLYSLSGLVAGGPRDFASSGGANPSAIEAASGDFLLSVIQGNNGNSNYLVDSDLTVESAGTVGNLVYTNAYAVAGGSTLLADGGSSTGFVTDITNGQGSAGPVRLGAIATFEAIPEPSSLALLGAAGGMLMMRRRRQG